jgi:hypothetical protein
VDAEPVSESGSTGEAPSSSQSEVERLRHRVAELEQANAELRRANVRLARERVGTLDSAAATELSRRAPSRARPAARVSGRVKSGLRALALRILR